jgi:hypothetical protein
LALPRSRPFRQTTLIASSNPFSGSMPSCSAWR